jgi:Protein O-mannosyl-transferase TMEM260-like
MSKGQNVQAKSQAGRKPPIAPPKPPAVPRNSKSTTPNSQSVTRNSPLASRFSLPLSLTASLIALVVYFDTLAPSVTWKHNGADSGDLVTAAFTLGIPRPPGYPLFTLVGSLFAQLPTFEPAAGVGIFVALAGAMAVFVLARAGTELIAPLVPGGLGAVIASLAALGFAFAPALWSQATIAEVYTLNLLFASVILWAMVTNHRHRVGFAAAAFGLGLAHHLAIVFFAPGALLALKVSRRDWRVGLLVLAPLLLYAYLPLRALSDPPVNWGDPRTLDRFLWVVTAAPYRSYLFDLRWLDIAARIEYAARLLFEQFTLPGVALALWGLVRLAVTKPRLASALELNGAFIIGYAVVYGSRDSFVYLLPAFAIVLLWLIYGAADVVTHRHRLPWRFQPPTAAGQGERQPTISQPTMTMRQVRLLQARLPAGARKNWGRGLVLLCLLALAALPAYNFWTNFPAMDLANDHEAFDYAQGVFEKVPPDAVIFAEGDQAVFALTYYRQAIAYETLHAVVVSQGLLQYAWYYDNLRRAMYEVTFAPPEVKTDFHQRAVEIASVTFAEGRAVCFTPSSPLLPEFDYETRGDLKCVVSQK